MPLPVQAKIDAWKLEAALLIVQQCCFSLEDALSFAEAAYENIRGDIEMKSPQDCVDDVIDAMHYDL